MPRKITVLAASAGLLVAGTVHAQHMLQSIEQAVESEPSLVMLPSAGVGSLTARECSECPDVQLKMNAAATLLVNNEPVSFADFQDEIIRHRKSRLLVLYRIEDRQVTQLRLAY